MGSTQPTYTTALISAAYLGYSSVVSAMLRGQATPALRDSEGNTALHAAVRNHQHGVIRVLLQTCCTADVAVAEQQRWIDINMLTNARSSALLLALRSNDLDAVLLLVDAGAQLSDADVARLQHRDRTYVSKQRQLDAAVTHVLAHHSRGHLPAHSWSPEVEWSFSKTDRMIVAQLLCHGQSSYSQPALSMELWLMILRWLPRKSWCSCRFNPQT